MLQRRLDTLILEAVPLGALHGYGVLLQTRNWNRMAEIIDRVLRTAPEEP